MLQNVIFDLGTVLLHIDTHRFLDALEAKGYSVDNLAEDTELFEALETGDITKDDFLDAIAMYLGPHNQEDVIDAWNSIIISHSEEGFAAVKACREKGLKTYILSNTNELHHECFVGLLDDELGKGVYETLFDKQYYSHIIGEIKPNESIYMHLINDGIDPSKSIFIDDKLDNVEAAEALGFKIFHYNDNSDWDLFLAELNA